MTGMHTHHIRLRGPWKIETSFDHPESTVHLPREWSEIFGQTAGTVFFRRRFHKPTNLSSHDTVSLGFRGLGASAAISLNDVPLGTIEPPETTAVFEITTLLKAENEVVARIEHDPDNGRGGLFDLVTLEIRSEAQ